MEGKTYLKITNKNRTHKGYTYSVGWNEVPDEEWNPSGDCEGGGFYVADGANIS